MAERDPQPPDSDCTPATSAPLFISYASNDAAVAAQLCAALEAAGHACWMAPRDVRAGESYAAAIINAIGACRMLILVLSASAAESPHVLREVERASSKRRPVISVRIEPVALPPELEYFLSVNQWLDGTGRGVNGVLPALLAAIGAVPARPVIAPSSSAVAATRHAWPLAATAVAALAAALVVGAWWVAHRPGPGAPVAQTAAVPTPPAVPLPADSDPSAAKSVAVLPFTDLSAKHDQQYFADGLAEQLIAMLAKVPGLRVAARASSFYFEGKETAPAEVARALHVSHVLAGSVRREGDRLRVSAELVRVADQTLVWSDTFDRKVDDIFKVQDDIAGAVVKALKGTMLRAALGSSGTSNTEAYTTYLQGKAILSHGTQADYMQAIAYYQRAVALDPAFARGWAAIADTSADAYAVFREGQSYPEVTARAHGALERALALQPDLADAYEAMGRLAYFVDLDWDTAEKALSRALELDPNNAVAARLRSYLAGTLGQSEAQRQFAQRAIANDPLDFWNYFAAGIAAYSGGRFEEAESAYRKAIELNARADGVHARLAHLLLQRGEPAEALAEIMRESSVAWRELALPEALDALGRRAEADQALAQAARRYGNTRAYWIALDYATRNDRDNAFKWLARSVRQRDATPIFQRYDPRHRGLEGDPRFAEFLRQMKVPP